MHISKCRNDTEVFNNRYVRMYLDYYNNYATISRYAADQGLSRKRAERCLIKGRTLRESQFYGQL